MQPYRPLPRARALLLAWFGSKLNPPVSVFSLILNIVSDVADVRPARSNLSAAQPLPVELFEDLDHPALLAWYISDEPTGHNMPAENLERSYRIVRELDPYHPVTIVFMAPPPLCG